MADTPYNPETDGPISGEEYDPSAHGAIISTPRTVDAYRKPIGAAMSVNNPPYAGPTAPQSAPGTPWAEVPGNAIKNFLPSAANFATTLVQPFIHPVDTANNIFDVTKGLASKYMAAPIANLNEGRFGNDPERLAIENEYQRARREHDERGVNAVGDYLKSRYGSVEGFKQTLGTDPVGVAADAATLLRGGAGFSGRMAPFLTQAASVVDPIANAARVAKLAGGATEFGVSHAIGATTGAGARDIRAAGRAGLEGNDTFTKNLRGTAPITDAVDQARSALDQVRADRAAAYKAGMVDVSKDKAVLDFDPIEAAVDNASKVGSYKGVVVNRSAGETNSAIKALVNEWKGYDPAEFHTPEGLDALKRTVADLRDSTEQGTPARVAADRVYQAIKGQIEQQAPGYAKTMGDYAGASDKIKDITKTLSLGEKTSTDTALRKLQSTSRNNVTTNYGARTKMLDELAKYQPNLPYALAGQNLNSIAPRGLVSKLTGSVGGLMAGGHAMQSGLNPEALMHTAALLPVAPFFSPRLMGEAAYLGGRAAGTVGNGLSAIGVTPARIGSLARGAYRAGQTDNNLTPLTIEYLRSIGLPDSMLGVGR